MKEHPYLVVIGAGRIEPEFETQPSPELVPILPMLALRSVSSLMWSNNPKDNECIPWGAGLCVRRTTAESYAVLCLIGKDSSCFAGATTFFPGLRPAPARGLEYFPNSGYFT